MDYERAEIDVSDILSDLTIEHTGCHPDDIVQLKGDASKRAIYRITVGNDSLIGIIGPDRAENEAFIGFSETFKTLNLPVADIYTVHKSRLAYLMEDLGDTTMFSHLRKLRGNNTISFPSTVADGLYKEAIEQLVQFQLLGADSIDYSLCYQFREFAMQSWKFDHDYFINCFAKVLVSNLNDWQVIATELNHHRQLLEAIPRDQFLYRDFQTRNIMLTDKGLRFIDYQSGRRGSVSYDIASLLYSTRAELPIDYRKELLEHHIRCISTKMRRSPKELRSDFAPYALMRVLQSLGAYGKLGLIQGRTEFLTGIPLGLENVLYLLESDDRLRKFVMLRRMFQQIDNDAKWHTVQTESPHE